MIGVGADSGEEQLATAKEILSEKGVTYLNVSPSPKGDFYATLASNPFFLNFFQGKIYKGEP